MPIILSRKGGGGTSGGGAPSDATYVTTSANGTLSNEQVLGTSVVMSGTLAARPAAGTAGRLYLATNVNGGTLYRDTGAAWVQTGDGAEYPAKNGQAGYLVPTALGWAVAAIGFAANRAAICRFVLPADFTVTSMKFRSTTGGTGNVDVGIYNSAGTLLASSGSTAGKKGANTTQTVTLSAPVALTAGTVYYGALMSDTGDGAYASVTFLNATEQLFGTTLGTSESGFRDPGAFPLPSPFGAFTTSGSIAAVIALI